MSRNITTILIIGNALKPSQAIELAQKNKNNKVKFILAGTLPHIPGDFYRIPSIGKLEQQLCTELKAKLIALGQCLGIANGHHYLTKQPIQHLAKALNAHLIIDSEEPPQALPKFASLFKKKTAPNPQPNNIPAIYLEDYLNIINLPPLKKEMPLKVTPGSTLSQNPVYHANPAPVLENTFPWLAAQNAIKLNFAEKQSAQASQL